jgi:hypothetical protein
LLFYFPEHFFARGFLGCESLLPDGRPLFLAAATAHSLDFAAAFFLEADALFLGAFSDTTLFLDDFLLGVFGRSHSSWCLL